MGFRWKSNGRYRPISRVLGMFDIPTFFSKLLKITAGGFDVTGTNNIIRGSLSVLGNNTQFLRQGLEGQAFNRTMKTAEFTLTGGAASEDLANFFNPAADEVWNVRGLTFRLNSSFSTGNTRTTITITDDQSSPTTWAAWAPGNGLIASGKTLNSWVDGTSAKDIVFSAAKKLTITLSGGAGNIPAGAKIRVTAHIDVMIAPTS